MLVIYLHNDAYLQSTNPGKTSQMWSHLRLVDFPCTVNMSAAASPRVLVSYPRNLRTCSQNDVR